MTMRGLVILSLTYLSVLIMHAILSTRKDIILYLV